MNAGTIALSSGEDDGVENAYVRFLGIRGACICTEMTATTSTTSTTTVSDKSVDVGGRGGKRESEFTRIATCLYVFVTHFRDSVGSDPI